MMDAERIAEIRARLAAASDGPWGWNSYSVIHSIPLIRGDENGPDYPETPRPGPPFGTPEDYAWLTQRTAAYESDATVARVPTHYGDTATGRHAADADLIANAPTDLADLLAALDAALPAMRLLESLTPGGSEYFNNPERCAKWVEDRLSNAHRITVDAVARRKEAEAALDAARADVARLRKALEASRISHLAVDDDTWYSCALSEERGGSCLRCDVEPPCPCGCNCGADSHNARIDAALAATEAQP